MKCTFPLPMSLQVTFSKQNFYGKLTCFKKFDVAFVVLSKMFQYSLLSLVMADAITSKRSIFFWGGGGILKNHIAYVTCSDPLIKNMYMYMVWGSRTNGLGAKPKHTDRRQFIYVEIYREVSFFTSRGSRI